MTTISAKTILRSRNATVPDKVLSALLLRYPRWIHAEGRTHRLLDVGEDFQISVPTPSLMECDDLSRNAGSSRAIPVDKLILDVIEDPAVPLFWGRNQRGMQASEELSLSERLQAENEWHDAKRSALRHARELVKIGCHKQIVNRLLEPFSHITVLVSATEWSNFLALRDHPDAEPHIAMLAREVRKCLDREDDIQTLDPGEWHTPFVDADFVEGMEIAQEHECYSPPTDVQGNAIKLSVARCASTSYKTVDGFDMTLERAVALHDKLVAATPLHASPCEHVAQADDWLTTDGPFGIVQGWETPEQHGNFVGFRQYWKMLPNECL